MDAAATKIQAYWRGCPGRAAAAELRSLRARQHAAATKIQAAWRGHAAQQVSLKSALLVVSQCNELAVHLLQACLSLLSLLEPYSYVPCKDPNDPTRRKDRASAAQQVNAGSQMQMQLHVLL